MSEEEAAFARHTEAGDPFPIAPDANEPSVGEPTEPPAPFVEKARQDDGRADRPASSVSADPSPADPLAAAVLAADGRHFLRALIGIVVDELIDGAGDENTLAVVLARLGQALAEEQDEELAFQDLVDAFDRRRLGAVALHAVAPVIAAFTARIINRALQPDDAPSSVEIESLRRAAEDVAAAALEAGGARAWRRLPELAVTIGERAARRGLSIAVLAEALPRLAERFGLVPRAAGASDIVATTTDHPRGELPRGEAADEPRRMVISGPVEIVILDR